MTDDAEARMRAYLESLPADEREALLAQARLNSATSRIAVQLARGELLEAWPQLHRDLRLAWVQAWQIANAAALHAHGWDLEPAADALTADDPSEHELWEHFAHVTMRDIARWELDPERLGVGATPRPVALNIEEVHIYPVAPESMEHAPDEALPVVQGLMILDGDDWLLLNIGSTNIPVPGYPPQL